MMAGCFEYNYVKINSNLKSGVKSTFFWNLDLILIPTQISLKSFNNGSEFRGVFRAQSNNEDRAFCKNN